MKLQIARPDESFRSSDKWRELQTFLGDHWDRANSARKTQLENYSNWEKNYRAIPAEAIRNVPWYKSSNMVVPVIRIFLDTFVARTLNIVFSTQPLLTPKGFPRELREALEAYLTQKALFEWE